MVTRFLSFEKASRDDTPPSLWLLAGEALAMRRRLFWNGLEGIGPVAKQSGQPVIVFPAFLAHEVVCTRLLKTLQLAGYEASTWGLGVNRGFREGLLEEMVSLVEEKASSLGRPVILLGWSLGGIFAREVAKLIPQHVERVVTLASPFSGSIKANNVWKIYEKVAGHPVDHLPIEVFPNEKPPVPTFALWSPYDGAVAPACARGLPGERDKERKVGCKHADFVSHPIALRAVLETLAEDLAT